MEVFSIEKLRRRSLFILTRGKSSHRKADPCSVSESQDVCINQSCEQRGSRWIQPDRQRAVWNILFRPLPSLIFPHQRTYFASVQPALIPLRSGREESSHSGIATPLLTKSRYLAPIFWLNFDALAPVCASRGLVVSFHFIYLAGPVFVSRHPILYFQMCCPKGRGKRLNKRLEKVGLTNCLETGQERKGFRDTI